MKQHSKLYKQEYVQVSLDDKRAITYIFTTYEGRSKKSFLIGGKRRYVWMSAYGLHIQEIHTLDGVIVEIKPKVDYGYLCGRIVDVNLLLVELQKCKAMDEMHNLVRDVLRPMFHSRLEHDAREIYKRQNESYQKQKAHLKDLDKKEKYKPGEWLKLLEEWRRMYK